MAKGPKVWQNGTKPSEDMPAAMPIMSASAMPHCTKRSGLVLAILVKPLAPPRSASRATTSSRSAMSSWRVETTTARSSVPIWERSLARVNIRLGSLR